MNVGKQIKELRLSAGINREQLAKDLQIGTSTLSGYKMGNRSAELQIILMCQLTICLVDINGPVLI